MLCHVSVSSSSDIYISSSSGVGWLQWWVTLCWRLLYLTANKNFIFKSCRHRPDHSTNNCSLPQPQSVLEMNFSFCCHRMQSKTFSFAFTLSANSWFTSCSDEWCDSISHYVMQLLMVVIGVIDNVMCWYCVLCHQWDRLVQTRLVYTDCSSLNNDTLLSLLRQAVK